MKTDFAEQFIVSSLCSKEVTLLFIKARADTIIDNIFLDKDYTMTL